jgi:branched-chain amino acid transport system permease protein
LSYILHLAIVICLYTLLAQSLNLSAGLAGMLSLTHAGFYGIGAYTTAILSQQFHTSFWLNLVVAMIICFVIAGLVSLISIRTVDEYFMICTLGVQAIVFSIMNNWMSVTRGPLGISAIPPIYFFGVSLQSRSLFLITTLSFMVLVWFILRNLFQSAFGKTLQAINEDEIYARSIGKNVYRSKVNAFTISAVLAVIPGALYAHYVSFIDPNSFTLTESIFVLSIVILGGLGNLLGSFLASGFMVVLPEILRFIGLPNNIAPNIRQIIYGSLLVLITLRGKRSLIESLSIRPGISAADGSIVKLDSR